MKAAVSVAVSLLRMARTQKAKVEPFGIEDDEHKKMIEDYYW